MNRLSWGGSEGLISCRLVLVVGLVLIRTLCQTYRDRPYARFAAGARAETRQSKAKQRKAKAAAKASVAVPAWRQGSDDPFWDCFRSLICCLFLPRCLQPATNASSLSLSLSLQSACSLNLLHAPCLLQAHVVRPHCPAGPRRLSFCTNATTYTVFLRPDPPLPVAT